MRILVVEDDTTLAAQLRAALEGAGFSVDVEHDGAAAAFAGATERYDAAVLDLGLPVRDGLSVLREWREAGHQRGATDILLMGHVGETHLLSFSRR